MIEAKRNIPWKFIRIPADNYMPKVKYRNFRTRSEICSKLRPRRHSGFLIVNFERISHLVL